MCAKLRVEKKKININNKSILSNDDDDDEQDVFIFLNKKNNINDICKCELSNSHYNEHKVNVLQDCISNVNLNNKNEILNMRRKRISNSKQQQQQTNSLNLNNYKKQSKINNLVNILECQESVRCAMQTKSALSNSATLASTATATTKPCCHQLKAANFCGCLTPKTKGSYYNEQRQQHKMNKCILYSQQKQLTKINFCRLFISKWPPSSLRVATSKTLTLLGALMLVACNVSASNNNYNNSPTSPPIVVNSQTITTPTVVGDKLQQIAKRVDNAFQTRANNDAINSNVLTVNANSQQQQAAFQSRAVANSRVIQTPFSTTVNSLQQQQQQQQQQAAIAGDINTQSAIQLTQVASVNSPTISSNDDSQSNNFVDYGQQVSNAHNQPQNQAINSNSNSESNVEAFQQQQQQQQQHQQHQQQQLPSFESYYPQESSKSSSQLTPNGSPVQPRSSSYQVDYYPRNSFAASPSVVDLFSKQQQQQRPEFSFSNANGNYAQARESHMQAAAFVPQTVAVNQQQAIGSQTSPSEIYDSDYASAASASPNTAEFERDLADLDEEFTRSTGFRNRPPQAQFESMFSQQDTKAYADQRRLNNKNTFGAEFAGASDFRSAYAPSNQHQMTAAAAAAQSYADALDANWPESSAAGDILGPSSSFYRWRPRSLVRPATAYGASPLLASASADRGSPISPYGYVPTSFPADAIGIALGPLAAAAAASALANVVDKSRQQSAPTTAWLAIPRVTVSSSTTTSSSPTPAPASATPASSFASASSQVPTNSANSMSALSAAANYYAAAAASRQTPTYGPPMPIYAYTQMRPTVGHPVASPLAGAASVISPSFIPYLSYSHSSPFAATPHFFYRPSALLQTAAAAAAAPLLASASYQYPLATIPRALPFGYGSPRAFAIRPLYHPTLTPADLHFEQSFQKVANKAANSSSSYNNGDESTAASTSSSTKGARNSISAIARNLSKKMFGSASQLRPSHVAPPTSSQFSQSHLPLFNELGGEQHQLRNDVSDTSTARMLTSKQQQQQQLQQLHQHQHQLANNKHSTNSNNKNNEALLLENLLSLAAITTRPEQQIIKHRISSGSSAINEQALNNISSVSPQMQLQAAIPNSDASTRLEFSSKASSTKHKSLHGALRSLVSKAITDESDA